MASWTDTEWVTGGVSAAPGVTASTFDIEQNLSSSATGSWTTNVSHGGTFSFGAAAGRLLPGRSVIGAVRLRAAAGSLGGTVQLVHGTSTGDAALLGALRYGAWLQNTAASCTAAGYNRGAAVELVPDDSALVTDEATSFPLAGSAAASTAGPEKTVCIRLTLPASASASPSLQGLTATPAWTFTATSS